MSKPQDKTLWITAKFDGRCACKTQYYAGDKVFWKPGTGILLCADCDAWMLDESESFVFPDIGDRT